MHGALLLVLDPVCIKLKTKDISLEFSSFLKLVLPIFLIIIGCCLGHPWNIFSHKV
jgi:hypothetical protein